MISSTPDHIHVGQDGWLFLKTGTNDVLGQYERPEETTELIWQWRSLVSTRERRLRAQGILYRHVVAPEKLMIYDHRLDGLTIRPSASPAYRLLHSEPVPGRLLGPIGLYAAWRRRKRWRQTCIDLVTPMRAQRDTADLYCRTTRIGPPTAASWPTRRSAGRWAPRRGRICANGRPTRPTMTAIWGAPSIRPGGRAPAPS